MQLNVFDTVVEQTDTTLPCRAFDPEVFFAETPADVEFAKAICVECPVKAACLAGALERREPWGVWGGELFVQGVVVARKRPRGRPRKDAALLDAALSAGMGAESADRVQSLDAQLAAEAAGLVAEAKVAITA